MNIFSTIWLLPLFTFIYVNSILSIEATHHDYRNLQSLSSHDSKPNQPYRTAYHFQPPKNWINGNSFILFLVFLVKDFISLTDSSFASCFCHMTSYAQINGCGLADPNG
jgi:hypothetical protein